MFLLWSIEYCLPVVGYWVTFVVEYPISQDEMSWSLANIPKFEYSSLIANNSLIKHDIESFFSIFLKFSIVYFFMDIKFDSPIFSNEKIAFDFCINEGLIDNQMKCINGHEMILAKDTSKKSGFLWKCPICKNKYSLLNGSVFADSNLLISKNLLLIYCWSMEISF